MNSEAGALRGPGPTSRLAALAIALAVGGCRHAYYGALDRFGYEKRHILESRVEKSQEDQRAAQEEFQSTFELFKQVTGYEGGDLEDFYRKMEKQLERSESKAQSVRERIDSIEEVGSDLFAEWESEIEQISSAARRREDSARMRATRGRYEQMLRVMRRAEAKMDPVLTAFRDEVLTLKHNLNASAIGSLQANADEIERDVAVLIREMQASIAETQRFLADFKASG
jgi:hypothetical protein